MQAMSEAVTTADDGKGDEYLDLIIVDALEQGIGNATDEQAKDDAADDLLGK